MTIELPAELENLVREKVEAGVYASEAEMVSSALELLALHDSSPEFRRKMLDAALEEGEADLRAGRYVTLKSKDEISALFKDITLRALNK
jgi:putative addiction module CopG family antidote